MPLRKLDFAKPTPTPETTQPSYCLYGQPNYYVNGPIIKENGNYFSLMNRVKMPVQELCQGRKTWVHNQSRTIKIDFVGQYGFQFYYKNEDNIKILIPNGTPIQIIDNKRHVNIDGKSIAVKLHIRDSVQAINWNQLHLIEKSTRPAQAVAEDLMRFIKIAHDTLVTISPAQNTNQLYFGCHKKKYKKNYL